jgi:hypothetical protein
VRRAVNAYLFMIREWADEDTHLEIDMALMPKGRAMADEWDDDEAWREFEQTMRDDGRR